MQPTSVQEQSSCVELSVWCEVIDGRSRRTAPQGAVSRIVNDVVLIDHPFLVIPNTGRPDGRATTPERSPVRAGSSGATGAAGSAARLARRWSRPKRMCGCRGQRAAGSALRVAGREPSGWPPAAMPSGSREHQHADHDHFDGRCCTHVARAIPARPSKPGLAGVIGVGDTGFEPVTSSVSVQLVGR